MSGQARTGNESLLSFALEHPLRYLWGLVADIGIALYTLVLGPLAIIATLLVRSGRPIDLLAKVWCKLIVWTCGIDVEVKGLEHVQPGRSYIIISNHLSNFDIWCTIACLPMNIRFVAKKELLRVPVFGQALALSDHIIIDRQRPESAIEAINAAVEKAPQGISILFYAEGTRSRDGKIHEFKKGGVTLALRTRLPILPLSVSGTRKFLPRGCAVIRPGGDVRMVLEAPVETTGLSLDERDRLNEQVRNVIVQSFIEDL